MMYNNQVIVYYTIMLKGCDDHFGDDVFAKTLVLHIFTIVKNCIFHRLETQPKPLVLLSLFDN